MSLRSEHLELAGSSLSRYGLCMNTPAEFVRFLSDAPTPYHAAEAVIDRLIDAGFEPISPTERWDPARQRFVVREHGGTVVAYDLGLTPVHEGGICVFAAHTDSPALKLKPQGAAWKRGYLMVPTEPYGAPIQATWLDRPLGVAGRAIVDDGSVKLLRLETQTVIPNLAIHLNRKINEGFDYDEQEHLCALFCADSEASDGNAEPWLRGLVATAVEVDVAKIIDYELFLHDPSDVVGLGGDRRFLLAPRADNLAGCFTNLQAFLAAPKEAPRMLALFDHEEIGSMSGDGALSDRIPDSVARIVALQGGDREDLHSAIARSIVVSNDAAHALHPSFADKYDPSYAPILGSGPVIKLNGSYRYATTTQTAARFAAACNRAQVPYQRLAMRSNARPGSTVGPLSWARSGIAVVDVGIPMLAMHSIRETIAAADLEMMISALAAVVH